MGVVDGWAVGLAVISAVGEAVGPIVGLAVVTVEGEGLFGGRLGEYVGSSEVVGDAEGDATVLEVKLMAELHEIAPWFHCHPT